LANNPELDKFNAVLRKVLSVPREELLRREKEWKSERTKKKRKAAKKAAGLSGKA